MVHSSTFKMFTGYIKDVNELSHPEAYVLLYAILLTVLLCEHKVQFEMRGS